jgi:hypothetical protein
MYPDFLLWDPCLTMGLLTRSSDPLPNRRCIIDSLSQSVIATNVSQVNTKAVPKECITNVVTCYPHIHDWCYPQCYHPLSPGVWAVLSPLLSLVIPSVIPNVIPSVIPSVIPVLSPVITTVIPVLSPLLFGVLSPVLSPCYPQLCLACYHQCYPRVIPNCVWQVVTSVIPM